jgi:Flp pilus assembly protein TadG
MIPARNLGLGISHRVILAARDDRGSALVEFAIVLPILTVFVVGIYDFSGAFNQKQKVAQAAQTGAIVAGAQPTSDITTSTASPSSLQPAVTAVFNYLADSGVLTNANTGSCALPASPGWVPSPPGGTLSWTYTITNCSAAYSSDNLVITINRGWTYTGTTPVLVGTNVQVQYPYHWRFGSVIQLLFPAETGYGITNISESSTVHNQI